MSVSTHQAIIIGAGFAGLSAAAELAQGGVQTALVDDGDLGGLIANVGVLEAPGPYDGSSGADLAGDLLGQALEAGVDYRMGSVAALEPQDGVWTLPELEIAAPSVVLATGARLRRLGVPGEDRLAGMGVSQCAFCDGGLYVGQPVVVIGGGDAAFQEALHLAEIGCAVTMLLRGDRPRARQGFVERAAALTQRTETEVLEILGTDGVEAVRLRDRRTGTEETVATRAVFVFVGLAPQSALAPRDAARNASDALKADESRRTGAAGLHAIGAVRAGFGGGLTDAADDARAVAKAIAAKR